MPRHSCIGAHGASAVARRMWMSHLPTIRTAGHSAASIQRNACQRFIDSPLRLPPQSSVAKLYRTSRSSARPFVQPKPTCGTYSPPDPVAPMARMSYFSCM